MAALAVRKGRVEPPEWKKRVVAELSDALSKYKYVLFVNLQGLPTSLLQTIRKQFKDSAYIKSVKKNLLYIALKDRVPREELEKYLPYGIVVIATNENPFLFAYKLDQIKIRAPIKPGQVATNDIVVPEGDTGLRPGPIVSVFGKLKIPYEVRKGTIYIKSDTVVAKKGDVVSPELAGLLQQLGIRPLEIGATLAAALDGTTIIPGDMLHIDLEGTKHELEEAAQESLRLAVGAAILFVPEALSLLLAQAEQGANALVSKGGLLISPELAQATLLDAEAEAMAITLALGDKAKELGLAP